MSARSCFALTILMLLGSIACTGRRTAPAIGASRQAVLEVDNRTWEALTIYLVREGGGPMRLGRVESLRRRQFRVMPGLLTGTAVQLQASQGSGQAIGSRGFIDPSMFIGQIPGRRGGIYITHPFDAPLGTAIVWVINPEMQLSSVSMT